MGTSVYVSIYVRREDVEKISKVTDLLEGEEAYEESPEWLHFLIEQVPVRHVNSLIRDGEGTVFVGEHSNSYEFGSYSFYGDGEKTDEWECAYDNTSALCVDVLNPDEMGKATQFAETRKRIYQAVGKSIEEGVRADVPSV